MQKQNGLSSKEVLVLQEKYGRNVLLSKEKNSWPSLLWNQFKSPFIYILLAVGAISFLLGEKADGSLALSVLVVNVLMGFYQEYSAQKTLAALHKLLKPKTMVIREGQRIKIEARDIVPGDVVVLGSGDKIPADGKLIESDKILINEAMLTGEEEAVLKNTESPNVFMGTIVVSGVGLMIVEKIGQTTEIGKIGQSLEEIKDEETPLQKRLEVFTKNLLWIILIVCFLIFTIGVLQQEDIWKMLRIAVILAIAAIPEALPIALTVILALGMRKILKRNGLVKKLLSIETLGSTSVICTDKTGTLTEGKMQVVKIDTNDQKNCLQIMALDNEQKSNLEIALWHYVKKVGQNPQEIYDTYEKVESETFDSEKKYSFSINKILDKNVSHLMGAPEKIVTYCDWDETHKKEILQKIQLWASQGLRILGLAIKETGDLKKLEGYTWVGLVGIQDPIRAEVKSAIEIAQNAGIKIKIVTGDYRITAEKIARNLGFEITSENVIEGNELEKLSDQELKNRVGDIVLFSRVLPHQKLKIVKALQDNGEIVAMTGDGVNDAPALKKSDIGMAVGSATEVAKEASDLILLDNNFKTIVAAVEEGRLIFSNIKKVVGYVISNSFAEIILIFGAMIFNLPAPITIVQILWVHLICDGPPDILLSFEPKESDLMEKKPQEIQKEEILSSSMKWLMLLISTTIGVSSLILFWYFQKNGNLDLARTVAFAGVGSADLIYILAYKNLQKPIYKSENFFTNKYLFYGIAYGFILLFIAIYVPYFNRLLKTTPLNLNHWLWIFGLAIFTTIIVEVTKSVSRKSKNQGQ